MRTRARETGRRLACGHDTPAIADYTDDCRWRVLCRSCGHDELWTQGEWSASLRRVASNLVRIQDDADCLGAS